MAGAAAGASSASVASAANSSPAVASDAQTGSVAAGGPRVGVAPSASSAVVQIEMATPSISMNASVSSLPPLPAPPPLANLPCSSATITMPNSYPELAAERKEST